MNLKNIHNLELKGKRVLLRLDLNVPMQDGLIQDETRILAALPTLKFLIGKGAIIAIASHSGRPEGQIVEKYRLRPLGEALGKALGQAVEVLSDCVGPIVEQALQNAEEAQVFLLENTRFHPEEEANDPVFSKTMAAPFDLFINDAFGAIHRGHASTLGVTEFLPSYAGFLLEKEISALTSLMEGSSKPLCLIVGGAKIDTKIGILESFLDLADSFILGGALANTFLAAQGKNIGASLYQEDKLPIAKDFLEKAAQKNKVVLLPIDVAVEKELNKESARQEIQIEQMQDDLKIFDIGSQTLESFENTIASSACVLWNGPMGLYEFPQYSKGTLDLAKIISKSSAQSIVGGGDTIDALKSSGLTEADFTHISTGGGAMLEFLEGKDLPGLKPLKN